MGCQREQNWAHERKENHSVRSNGVSLEHLMATVLGRKLDILWETKLGNLWESLRESLLESPKVDL